MDNLTTFRNEQLEYKVRVIKRDGEPWFVGRDVASILGYYIPDDMYKVIDSKDKEDIVLHNIEFQNPDTYRMIIINEPGLYDAISFSGLPRAVKFEQWITSVVIPTVRKTNMMIFENHEVEVFELNGKLFYNPYHVGECLGLTRSTVRNHLAMMNENQAVLLTNSDVGLKNIRKLNNAGEIFLTGNGVHRLAFASEGPHVEKFIDWVTNKVVPSMYGINI